MSLTTTATALTIITILQLTSPAHAISDEDRTAIIVGASIGSIVVVAICAILIWACCCRKSAQSRTSGSSSNQDGPLPVVQSVELRDRDISKITTGSASTGSAMKAPGGNRKKTPMNKEFQKEVSAPTTRLGGMRFAPSDTPTASVAGALRQPKEIKW